MLHLIRDYGLKVELPKNSPTFIAQVIDSGNWEAEECRIISHSIKKHHRVLEGGSGLGVTTALLARQSSFVVSLEANPLMAKTAAKNQKLNNSPVEIINAALSTKDGEDYFNFSDNLWDSRLVRDDRKINTKKVKVLNAARLIKEHGINALVLDIEGEEEAIIDKVDLSPISVLLVEIHQHIDKDKIINKVRDSGFTIMNRQDKSSHSILWAEKRSSFIKRLVRIK